MSSAGDESKVLASLCAKCGGRCCRSYFIPLSGEEYRRLKAGKNFREKRIDSSVGVCLHTLDAYHQECSFLGEGGCALGGKERPLICRLYPLVYALEAGEIRFYLSKFCPYGKEIAALEKWVEESKNEALAELRSSWKKKEVLCLGRFFRENKEKLIELDR